MISEATVNAAYRGLRYIFCYKSIVNNFNSEFDNFNIEEGKVSRKVVEEKDSGKIIEDDVTEWQEEVEGIQQDSKEFLERYENRASWKCIKCVPIPNPFNRFRIGRDAEKKAEKLAALTQSGKDLLANPIARLPSVENLPKTDGEFQNFQSRKDAYEKIWKSLVSEGGPQILGIYGMPGVGKTRIADQIWKEAKEKGIFKKVTKAVVSSEKYLDVKRLQNELAGDLNCSLESQDDIKRRASQLKQSIINGDKVLVILDDVWREIPLHDIGIPIGHDDTTISKGSCKILLTSREEYVLRGNNCIDPVKITGLKDDEAWVMFKESVGTGKIPDESLARKVCDKCAGLPLVIRAVGKALMKFKSRDMWKDALQQLENCDIESVPGIDAEVYACLKLSFDKLEKDAKLCLLLCSLYPEDAIIPINMLIMLATGSQLVQGGQIRVRAMVALLKSSSLVLESEYFDDRFKLHDIIRDVARSIAVNDHAFIFPKSSDSRLLHVNNNPELLCLDVNDNYFYVPDEMMYEGIHTLWIGSISYKRVIFEVWKVAGTCVNLRCLIVLKIKLEVPLEQYLGKLRMLVFDDCDIRKTDFNFISEKLETLCIRGCDLPEPLNIINLKHLRKLEINSGRNEVVLLVANTISSLSSCLEELHIQGGYIYQQEEDEVNDNNSISQQQQQQLMEISKLTRLKSLKMSFTRSASPPHEEEHIQDLKKVFSNLSEFDISFDSRRDDLLRSDYDSLTRLIDLSGNQLETDTFQILIERAQFVCLLNVDVSSSSSIFNCSTEEAFADLKYLFIENSDTMEHVAARISHHHHHIQPRTSSFFKQLTTLQITNCSAMRYLFSNSVAKCLVQLEKLWVKDCNRMEAIVMNDGSSSIDGHQDIIINFPKLKSLTIESTPQLKSFYLDNKVIIYSTNLFDDKIAFPALEELCLFSLSISDIWGKHYFNDDYASSFSKLQNLWVSSCTKLETVIPLAMLHKLQNLECLRILDCSSVIHEVGTYDDNSTAVVCPILALTEIYLHKLPCLTKTWLNSIILDHSAGAILTNLYPNLKKLRIEECNGLSNVFLPCIAGDLMHLEELHLDSCKMMTEIIGAAAGHDYNIMSKDVFPNLVSCRIMCCDKINFKDTEFWRDGVPCQLKSLSFGCDEEIQLNIPCTWDLRNLEELTLANCWWHEQHIIPSFSRLRLLRVIKSGQSTLFPVSVISSSLQQLQLLEISDCALLEDIVTRGNAEASSREKKQIIEFIQLKRVVLKDLPKLRCFMSGADYECHMPALKDVRIDNCGFSTLFPFSVIRSLQQLVEIRISNCGLLEGIVEEDVRKRGNIEASSSRDKNKKIIEFIQLGIVILKDLPNLRSFMYGADYECHMPALQNVEIDNCGFSTLFTCSTNLQQLCWLQVSNCKLLEYIVRDDDDDISKTDDKIITTLDDLRGIELKNLPNLKSFSRASRYAFDMPDLSHFTLLQCPQLVENFSSLKISTKRSIRVYSDWDKDGKHILDLNDYIKQNQKRDDDSNLIRDDEGAAAGETIDSNFSRTG